MSVLLNKLIELYLNDVADFNEDDHEISETVLRPLTQLISEDGSNQSDVLKEAYGKASPEHKPIFEDFFHYIKGIK